MGEVGGREGGVSMRHSRERGRKSSGRKQGNAQERARTEEVCTLMNAVDASCPAYDTTAAAKAPRRVLT